MHDRTSTSAPRVKTWFHAKTNTACHCVVDPQTGRCAIIDSVLDFDFASGRTSTEFADTILAHLDEQGLVLEWILETHVHADHLSAAQHLKAACSGRIGIGEHIREVQRARTPPGPLPVLPAGARVCAGSDFHRRINRVFPRHTQQPRRVEVVHHARHSDSNMPAE